MAGDAMTDTERRCTFCGGPNTSETTHGPYDCIQELRKQIDTLSENLMRYQEATVMSVMIGGKRHDRR